MNSPPPPPPAHDKESLHAEVPIVAYIHEAHLTLAKTKIQKTWSFLFVPFTLPEKTHNSQGFWHEKRMREKTRISYLCFGKWCACATSLYLWLYTCSAHYVAGRGRVIPLKVTYHVTKNPNNTGEIGASVYIGKKPVKFWRSFKKSRCGGGFFDSGFFGVNRGSCLPTFPPPPECEKGIPAYIYASAINVALHPFWKIASWFDFQWARSKAVELRVPYISKLVMCVTLDWHAQPSFCPRRYGITFVPTYCDKRKCTVKFRLNL